MFIEILMRVIMSLVGIMCVFCGIVLLILLTRLLIPMIKDSIEDIEKLLETKRR
jgi:hypothetical protein